MRQINKIDFAGFTFNGIHTSQLGLYSVSNGDRYDRNLSPSWNLQTGSNGGRHGVSYFGYQYTQQVVNITLSTDSVTEEEYRQIKNWLSSDISPLIFDERPYIQYYARVSTQPTFSFMVFDEEVNDVSNFYNAEYLDVATKNEVLIEQGTGRIYKGDIVFSFIIYEPFGYSVKKFLNEYTDSNKNEWATASRMRVSKGDLDTAATGTGGATQFTIYNAGDLEADYILSFSSSVTTDAQTPSFTFSLDGTEQLMTIDTSKLYKDGLGYTYVTSYNFKIDTKKHLVSCTINGKDNGSNDLSKTIIANNCVTKGDFFKIPISKTTSDMFVIKFSSAVEGAEIDYKYKYL